MKRIPVIALHLQQVDISHFVQDNYCFSTQQRINLDPCGERACSRASRPYTNMYTPPHMIKGGYTPSGKYRNSKVVPGKTDKRVGK